MAVQAEQSSLALVPPSFIAWCVIGMSSAILVSSWMHFQVFLPADRPLMVQPVSSEQIATFAQSGTLPTLVEAGFIINRFLAFNVANNKFIAEGTLWFYFDPRHIEQSTIDTISFENGSFLEKSAPQIQAIGDHRLVRYTVRIKFQTILNYAAFPDDDHILTLIMIHKSIPLHKLQFAITRPDFIIQDEIGREGWTIFDRSAQAGYLTSSIDSAHGTFTTLQPAVALRIDIRRTSMREFITLLFPMLIMLIMSLSTFSVAGPPERLSLTLSSIAGLVAFRFVMDSTSPKVPYFMLSDYLFLLFLSTYVFLFFMNLISNSLSLNSLKVMVASTTLAVATSCLAMWFYF